MQEMFQNALIFWENNQWISWLLILWATPWKGVALWKSARKKQLYWFIAFLLINTVGLLEILYIFVFSKMEKKEVIPAKPEEAKE
jgi:hypothetical protein